MTTIEQVDVKAMQRGLELYHDVSLRGRFRSISHPDEQFGAEFEGCRRCEQKRTDSAPDYGPERHKYPVPNLELWKEGADPWKDDAELARLRAAIDARYAALFVKPDGSILPVDECYPRDDNWAEGSVGFCDACRSEWDEMERYWADPAVLVSLWLEATRRLEYLLGMSDHEVWGDTRVRKEQRERRERLIEIAHSGETLKESWEREKRERARGRGQRN
ncbi:MAG: hypothetical protein F4047_03625 [Caldilineaceae bacterium SB0670_bin_27]|uniref:Uncharacterized protein n=1 Tax=Caldilineaceae bacterium SB0664_bin_27 TaxID=2605260 RepID=A0A6B0YWD9_9CHLR|nr:hypothetical protein [Caldilineaceae bacterium SB0664_bin_27]MYJ77246.1 hypothetical protein [Caldilineaceae bacterium SB0670_bin_27]